MGERAVGGKVELLRLRGVSVGDEPTAEMRFVAAVIGRAIVVAFERIGGGIAGIPDAGDAGVSEAFWRSGGGVGIEESGGCSDALVGAHVVLQFTDRH